MPDESEALASIIVSVRLLFHRLRAASDRLHDDIGITAPMRGVMESLARRGAMTVPQLAAERPVSRQHMQTQVNALVERDLIRMRDNPAHKRSPLFDLSDAGRTLFGAMQAREAAVLDRIVGEFPPGDMAVAARVLKTLADRFADPTEVVGGPEAD